MKVIPTAVLIGITYVGATPGVEAQPTALDSVLIQQAIDWGRSEEPAPYRIFHAPGEGRNPHVVGLVYTPFLRVALAARAAQEAGHALDASSLPAWLVAPMVHIAVRWYTDCELTGDAIGPAVEVVSSDAKLSLVRGPGGIPPTSVLAPQVLAQFRQDLPFTDITHVVAYPIDLLRQDVDLMVFNRGNPDRLCVERGRILRTSTATWR